jgi:hypothetical protein
VGARRSVSNDKAGAVCDSAGMAHAALRFQFDEKKAVEALTYIASKWPGITAFFASKVLFLRRNIT